MKFIVFDSNIPKSLEEATNNKPTGMLVDWEEVVSSDYLTEALIERKYPMFEFTGLKDFSGNEMYEGHILSCNGCCGFPNIQVYGSSAKTVDEIKESLFVIVKTGAGFMLRHIYDYVLNKRKGNKQTTPNSSHLGWKPVDNFQFWNLQRSFDIVGHISMNEEILKKALEELEERKKH